MREADDLEPAGEALGEAAPDEQGRGTDDQHPEGQPGAGVLVPEALHRFGPVRDLLYFVQDQHRTGAGGRGGSGSGRQEARGLPLLLDPGGVPQRGLVGAGVAEGPAGAFGGLLRRCRLADLAGAGNDLEEPARLRQAGDEFRDLRPVKGFPITQCAAYFCPMPLVFRRGFP